MFTEVQDVNNASPESEGAHGVAVSHPLRMRKALGSNPSVSFYAMTITGFVARPSRGFVLHDHAIWS